MSVFLGVNYQNQPKWPTLTAWYVVCIFGWVIQTAHNSMKSKIEIPQDILASIDFANTVNGGMSETVLNVERSPEGYQITVKAPSLRADDFEVNVLHGRLLVHQFLPLFGQNQDSETARSMRMLGNFYLPNDADFENISARYDQSARLLRVFMPFNDAVKDRRWHIDVEE